VSRKAFELYQYAAPAVLAPLSLWLWWRSYGGDWRLTLIAWSIPIVYAYVVPAIGTNVLKVWEFDTRFRLGRFRLHHGFVFGSATATIAWICHADPARGPLDALRTGFVLASVLGFWNLLYDVKALQSGILRVYNQPWADGSGAEAVAMDYAPWFFAGFGAVYGLGIGIAEMLSRDAPMNNTIFGIVFATVLACAMAVPVLGYRRRSFGLHGHSGCSPVEKKAP
jgi:hypothetical protein